VTGLATERPAPAAPRPDGGLPAAARTATLDVWLGAALEPLGVAIGGYLSALRASWRTDPAVAQPDADPDVLTLMAAVGLRPGPSAVQHAWFDAGLAAMDAAGTPVAGLVARLGLDRGAALTLAATWWAESDPQFAVVLGCAHDDAGRRHATAALLRLVLEPYEVALPLAWDDTDPVVRLGVLEPGAGPDGRLRLTPTARRLLSGTPGDTSGSRPTDCPARHGRLVEVVAGHLRSRGAAVALLRGPDAAGRREVAAAAAAAAGTALAEHSGRSDAELRLLARGTGAVPLVPAERLAALEWSPADGPLLAWGDEAAAPPHGEGTRVVDVTAPTAAERVEAWTRALAGAGLAPDAAPGPAAVLGARLALTERAIRGAVSRARSTAEATGAALDADLLWAAARQWPGAGATRVSTRVRPTVDLDALVVSTDVRAQLDELVGQVAMQHVVLDEWGFRTRLPRGQGVVALLCGPPGTGKSMAAEAVAGALQQDLLRVDLSMVVSKYVGETEKNLAAAFDDAERAGAVLFFDECDGLFGKRAEQHDAHDRWANLETDFLLQRVETFTGLVLLATNRRSALDEAFLRRLRFSIRFELPDARLRQELWRRVFPAGVPVDDLDVDALARRDVAGGTVLSSAVAAAFLAAADGGRVTGAHVEHAMSREYTKLGKAWTGSRS